MSLTFLLLSATPSARGVRFSSHGIGARLCFCFWFWFWFVWFFSLSLFLSLCTSVLAYLTLVALQKKKRKQIHCTRTLQKNEQQQCAHVIWVPFVNNWNALGCFFASLRAQHPIGFKVYSLLLFSRFKPKPTISPISYLSIGHKNTQHFGISVKKYR